MVLLRACTAEARDWLEENVRAESWQHFGAALAVDRRYVPPIIAGLEEHGFSVAGSGY